MTKHEIGKPRVYPPGEKPAIFPGEMACAEAFVTPEEVQLHQRAGFPIDFDGRARVTVTPMPGVYGALLRWRWRLFRAAPTPLVVSMGCSWLSVGLASLQLFDVVSWGYRPAMFCAFGSFALSMSHLMKERIERRRRRRVVKPWEVR